MAGLADPERGQPIDGDTLINVWSAGKGVVVTTMHALVEQGELEYDAPVTRYWPEYGANGKERTTVANLLTHSAGVPQLPPDGTPEQVADVAAMAGWIAQQAPCGSPARPPGTTASRSASWSTSSSVAPPGGTSTTSPESWSPVRWASPTRSPSVTDRHRDRLAVLVDEEGPRKRSGPSPPTRHSRAWVRPLWPQASLGNRPDFQAASIPAGVTTTARAWPAWTPPWPWGARRCADPEARDGGAGHGPADHRRRPDRWLSVSQVAWLQPRLGRSFAARRPDGLRLSRPGGNLGYAEPEFGFAIAIAKNRMTQAWPGAVEAEVRTTLGLPLVPSP
jgi:beta-lactamase family protein